MHSRYSTENNNFNIQTLVRKQLETSSNMSCLLLGATSINSQNSAENRMKQYQLHRSFGSAFPTHIKVCIWMIWIAILSVMAAAQTNFAPLRINCGGPRYVDPDTKFVWLGDSTRYVTTGSTESLCSNQSLTIANTTKSMRGIYCCNRFFRPRLESQHYTIPVLNSTASYLIRLHFAELVSHS
jgi:Malectin domain